MPPRNPNGLQQPNDDSFHQLVLKRWPRMASCMRRSQGSCHPSTLNNFLQTERDYRMCVLDVQNWGNTAATGFFDVKRDKLVFPKLLLNVL